MFNIGNRVVYISGAHGASPSNPLIDTSWFCEGTITELYEEDDGVYLDEHYPIRVKWDNKNSNVYKYEDLKIVYIDLFKDLKDFIDKELRI